MKKIALVLMSFCLIASAMAQTVADGKKFIYYGKNKSALDALKKLYEANSKDAAVIYWYGQAMLEASDIAGAKALYQKALQEAVNDALVIVGSGHVEILEGGDINSAKQKFEQAITMTTETKGRNKGKTSPAVLQAIGRANADGNSKQGDPLYGIEKLKLAAAGDLLATEPLIDMGISYLKLGGDQGGEAVKAYQEALNRDPKSAVALYRIGLIYQSQNNKDLFEEYYNKAIAADVAFPKTYLSLYNFYANRDVNVAKEYIEKYIQHADKDCATDFFYADYLFRAGKYQESLDKAKSMESGNCKGYYQIPLLYAYNYDRLGDSVKAKQAIDNYFATTAAEKITINDYDIEIGIYSKFPGQEQAAVEIIKKAIALDTIVNEKAAYMNKAAELMGRSKNYGEQVKWLQEAIKIKGGTMGEADYYKLANTTLTAKDYSATMEIAKQYIAAFPDKPQGYFFNVRAAKAIDTAATLGTAVEPILQQNEYLLKEKEKNKKAIYNNYYYLMGYHANGTKDYVKALEFCEKAIELIPEDVDMLNNKKLIQDRVSKNTTPSKTETKPNSKP